MLACVKYDVFWVMHVALFHNQSCPSTYHWIHRRVFFPGGVTHVNGGGAIYYWWAFLFFSSFLEKNTSLSFFNYFNSGLYYFNFDFLFLALL